MRHSSKERKLISDSPQRRPYGARFAFMLESQTRFLIDAECSFLVDKDMIVGISPSEGSPPSNVSQIWNVHLEGFSTAGEAEREGLRTVLGFLWIAVVGGFAIRLSYQTPLPCEVYNRTTRGGILVSGRMTAVLGKAASSIVAPLNSVIRSKTEINPRLLLAMELFTSARLETTERARFVAIVSSLEPLAFQKI